ncbi:ABC transporter permease [Psychrobacillus sp. OK032]|uniref:ABC transporter permease n=1 Tax=Psychrobacillus sp. OK032 TaxID=1884358 RepID=UPI0008C1021B|nr:ABC transporter permease [Psychrobacillus sp. OK032]SES19640.1 ABC-2 type transport system permease protein [Psychrobacillus sp. OK032]
MNNLREIWGKRFVFYINELQKYLKYIFTGHIAIVFVFVIGAGGYTYSEWLNTAPKDFPAFLVVAFILSILIAISSPTTLMKHADSVYFLPLETKLKEYINLALRWTFFSSVFLTLAAFLVSIPLLTKVAGATKNEVLSFFIFVLILKYWSIHTEFNYRFASNGRSVWVDRFIRFLLLFAALYFLLSGNYVFLITIVIIQLIYAIVWQKKKKEVPFPFEHFIEVEQSRMMRFYRFANYFTDVPHIRGMTKRRRWLDVVYNLVPYAQKNSQLYLVLRTFIRTNDYFYLWVRLTVISVIGVIFIPFPVVAIIFTGALAFATVVQLRHALLAGHEFRMDQLFPIEPNARKWAVNKFMRMIQFVQAILVLIVVLIQGELEPQSLFIPIAVYIVSELTIRMSKK